MRIRSSVAAAALATSVLTATAAQAHATQTHATQAHATQAHARQAHAAPRPTSTATPSSTPGAHRDWTWFAIFTPQKPGDRKHVKLASCLSAPDPTTGLYTLIFQAVRPDDTPPAGTCLWTKLPDLPHESATTPTTPHDQSVLAGQAGLVNLNNLDLLHNVNVVVGLCGNNINVLGVQVPVQHVEHGKDIPILSPGPGDSAPSGCTANTPVDFPKP